MQKSDPSNDWIIFYDARNSFILWIQISARYAKH